MSCPVCFNAAVADETVRSSMNIGIGVLFAITAAVLAGFLRFVISIARRATVHAAAPRAAAGGTLEPAGAPQH